MTKTVEYDIPAGPVEEGISSFLRATGNGVMVAPVGSFKEQNAAVRGSYTPYDALERVLNGNYRAELVVGQEGAHVRIVPNKTAPVPRSAYTEAVAECTCVRLSQFDIPTPWCRDEEGLHERADLCLPAEELQERPSAY